MGYEVRMVVATTFRDEEGSTLFRRDGFDYVFVKADFYLGKLDYDGPYHALLDKARVEEERRYYFYAKDYDGEELKVKKDPYDDYIQRLEVADVIEALEAGLEDWPDHVHSKAVIAALREYQEAWKDSPREDLIVLHYGY